MTAASSETRGANGARPLGHVDEYLALGQRAGASDIHLGINAPPIWRLNGILRPIWPDAAKLSADETTALAEGFLSDAQKTQLNERGDADFAYADSLRRLPPSVLRQRLAIAVAFRLL